MEFVIYSPASEAEKRHQEITEAAIAANFLKEGENYAPIIYHPTQDKAALQVVVTEAIMYNFEPIRSLNFKVFFSKEIEDETPFVEALPPDWNYY